MKRKKRLSTITISQSIEWAKQLVEGHSNPAMSPGERLREIGKKLNVTRIEPGAARTVGFLKRLPDRSFAIYYSDGCGVKRRRFTVAHELAHLVLERFHRHLDRDRQDSGEDGYRREVEGAVDRIASELVMPEALVIGLMKTQCQLHRERSDSGIVQKRMVLQTLGQSLGVSERALVHRLLELPDLLSVLLRVQWNASERPVRPRYFPPAYTRHSYLRIVEGLFPDPSHLANEDGWDHQVHVQTEWGRRLIHCHAWRRSANCAERGDIETWILGWAWNAFPLPAWDDSEHKGGTPDVIRVREFEARLGKSAELGPSRMVAE